MLPPFKAPYLILVCFAKSSALSIGESIRSTVRNAAKLAVYDEIIISVKNHHIPATTLQMPSRVIRENNGFVIISTYRVETALIAGKMEKKEN